jgi:hypothetical protein
MLRKSLFALVSTLLLTALPTVAAPNQNGAEFMVDLSRTHWCYDCVAEVVDKHRLMNGYSDHTFRGDWQVSRYVLSSIVSKVLNEVRLGYKIDLPSQESKIRDYGVLPEHWAYPYVRTLVQDYNMLELLFADPATQGFAGDRPVTRQELAYVLSEIVMRAEKIAPSGALSDNRDLLRLAVDYDAQSPYASYIQAAVDRYQFMGIYADHTFKANQPITRYELAAGLCRLYELLPKLTQPVVASGTP